MGSAVIAMTRNEMEADTDVDMDAENGDVMDTEVIDEITNKKDTETVEAEKCVPTITGEVLPHHLDSPRVHVTLMRNAGVTPQRPGEVRAPTTRREITHVFTGEAQR